MGPIEDEAVILRTHPLGETSLIVSMLTRADGRVRVVAKGGRQGKGPFVGVLQPGTRVDALYYPKGGRLGLLKEASVRGTSLSIASSVEGFALLLAAIELVEPIESKVEELFEDLTEYISFLEDHPGIDSLLPIFALEARLLTRLGLEPSLEACGECGQDIRGAGGWFSIPDGSILCGDCFSDPESVLQLEEGTREVLVWLFRAPFVDTPARTLEAGLVREVGVFLHRSLVYHMDGYRLPVSLGLLRSYKNLGTVE